MSEEKKEVTLSNGAKLLLDPNDRDKSFDLFVEHFLKPFYLQTNDWAETIRQSIKELEHVAFIFHYPRTELIRDFLHVIEGRLAIDIAGLTGTDKIEILFESVEDYIANIIEIVKTGESQEDTRLKIATLVEGLNSFEICELLIHFARKNQKLAQ